MARPRLRTPGPAEDDLPLDAFHDGRPDVLEACYREQFAAVDAAVGQILSGADRETAVHEVFYRLLSSRKLREGFRGGSLVAWLTTVARHHAIDVARRRRFETPGVTPDEAGVSWERQIEARLLVEQFRHEHLPPKWWGVFDARFLRHLDQKEAARELGIARTTLAYQEHRIRRLLRRFLLAGGPQ